MPEYRNVEGKIRLLQRENDFLFPVEIYLLDDQVNRNKWRFVNLEEHREKWAGIPILVAYVNMGTKIGDGHNQATKIDRNGKEYQSFTGATAERICGSMSENPDDIRIEEIEGKTWTVGRGTLWAWYSHELCMQIDEWAREGQTMSVSIEALVEESYMDGNVEVETRFVPLGVTVLGKDVRPAVDGAHIRALSEESGFDNLKLRAASYNTTGNEGEKEEPHTETQIKPQKNLKEKEIRAMKAFSKKQLALLSEKFPDYKLLAAGSNETGTHICMMSADGVTAVYTMADQNETIVPEKILHVNSQISFEFGEEQITVDLCDAMDELMANEVRANSKIEKLEKDLKTAQETITDMNAKELVRRKNAAKAKAEAVLASFNAARSDKVDCATIEGITAAIECGDYSECVDKEGNWCGEAMVERDVMAKCAEAQMALDKKNIERNRNAAAWGRWDQIDPNMHASEHSEIADLIAGLGEV